MKKTHHFTSHDGVTITYFSWLPEEKPVAVLQISHGMAEFAERYDDFATYLNKDRIAVYANDHRGHGKTAGKEENLGYFADKNGWMKVVEDMRQLTEIIRKKQPELPVFLMGHSMGSFLARTYITKYDDIQGVILSGTANNSKMIVTAGRAMAGINRIFSSPKKASTFFDNMSFGAFNKPFEKEGPMSWLSRDKEMVKKYVDDPYCGFVCSLKFFQDLFSGLSYIGKSKNNRNVRFSLPIYIVAGSNDPVGEKGKGPTAVAKMYRDLHLEEVELTLYENARHEILNETNRKDVYKDLKDWINDHID